MNETEGCVSRAPWETIIFTFRVHTISRERDLRTRPFLRANHGSRNRLRKCRKRGCIHLSSSLVQPCSPSASHPPSDFSNKSSELISLSLSLSSQWISNSKRENSFSSRSYVSDLLTGRVSFRSIFLASSQDSSHDRRCNFEIATYFTRWN